ncbi:hypothetical protein Tco_0375062 [Tanacetum coccineum]
MEEKQTTGDGEFVMGGPSVNKVKDPRVKLAHRCIATTISGQKESIQRITEIDLFFLYCIYTDELDGGTRYWPTTCGVGEDDEVEEAAEEGAGQMETWMTIQDGRSNWMYDHIVRHFQYMSTRDNLNPHLQIDLFPGREVDYPPYGYTRPMPPDYDYQYGPALGGSN